MSEGLWALSGVIVGALTSGIINFMLQQRKFVHEKEMYILQNQGIENVKSLLIEMLSHKSYTDRSFEAIKKKIGGYTDDKIRQLLHEIDAKKVTRNSGGEELWYLTSREEERIKKTSK